MKYKNTSLYNHHRHLDLMREYHHEYKRRLDVKRCKSILRILALKEEICKELKDKKKGLRYEKNIAGPKNELGEKSENEKAKKKAKKNGTSCQDKICQTCGKTGHVRTTHSECTGRTQITMISENTSCIECKHV